MRGRFESKILCVSPYCSIQRLNCNKQFFLYYQLFIEEVFFLFGKHGPEWWKKGEETTGGLAESKSIVLLTGHFPRLRKLQKTKRHTFIFLPVFETRKSRTTSRHRSRSTTKIFHMYN